jgi:hypothetical protein
MSRVRHSPTDWTADEIVNSQFRHLYIMWLNEQAYRTRQRKLADETVKMLEQVRDP